MRGSAREDEGGVGGEERRRGRGMLREVDGTTSASSLFFILQGRPSYEETEGTGVAHLTDNLHTVHTYSRNVFFKCAVLTSLLFLENLLENVI